ncbi:MAG TPA: insulinase family protein, partial [Actinomycetota bacterium]|nr:insulinase family protein [Actinomycetota bacterium]
LNAALGGGMSSRLFQEIREQRGLVYTVSSGYQGFRETGLFQVYAGCSPENVYEVLSIVREITSDVAAKGLQDDEFARAKRFVRGSLLLGLDEQGALMSHLGKTELLLGAVPSPDEMAGEIDRVTPDDVRAAAADVLGAHPWSLVVVGPSLEKDVSRFVGAAA